MSAIKFERVILEYRIDPGVDVSRAVDELLIVANTTQMAAAAEFNGTRIVANPGNDPRMLFKLWNVDFEYRAGRLDYKSHSKQRAEILEEFI